MGVPLSGKWTLPSNISSLIKGLSKRSIFNAVRIEIFVPSITSEPGDHPLTNLLFFSSYFEDKQYFILLVYGYHHFIVALLFV